MSSVPTFKDLTKALQGFVPNARLPLPEDLVEIIDAYIQKHDSKFDGNTADKAHEELLSLFRKDVVHTPARYTPFIAIVRRLRPLVAQPDKISQWFELLLPVLDHLNEEKGLVSVSQDTLLDVLTADDRPGEAAIPLAERQMTIWLDDCDTARQGSDAARTTKEKFLRETLVLYGKKRPKELMEMVDKFLVRKEYRARILTFLAEFVKSQPPHLHLILQTPLFGNLINCLQHDTSTTVVSLALTGLTMVLPHMPSSLVPHLPTLFNIYARLLFWERELSTPLGVERPEERRLSSHAPAWERCAYSPGFDGSSIPHLLSYFTILYGLYPINFMDYIRKPQRYLRHAEVPDSDDIEVQPTEMRHASERFRQCHLLHENFYTLTIESEKTDFGRWIKSEPSGVVADCMALRTVQDPTASHSIHGDVVSGAPEFTADETDAESGASALLSRSATMMRHSSQSSRQSFRDTSSARPPGESDSPVLSRQTGSLGSQTQLQDMLNSNKVIKSGLNQTLANDSVPSLALSHQETASERPNSQLQPNLQFANSPFSGVENASNDQYAYLRGQILLLQVDLTFERFMKQQHLMHMGELRRRQVREAASEAETQNLIIQNRHLRQRFDEAKKSELQVKKESERSRTLAKRWEADITAKLRTLREEQKKWIVEEKALRTELESARSEADKLVQLVCDAEVRELGLKQNMQSVEISVSELERLREEVERLTESERNLQAKETERQVALTQSTVAETRAETLSLQLKACETELQQVHDSYQSQISDLNAKLRDALKNSSGRHVKEDTVSKLETCLALARAQQEELKKRIAAMARERTTSQATIMELQSKIPSRRRSKRPRPGVEADDSTDSDSKPTATSIRNHPHGDLSDPESFMGAASSYEATPPPRPVTPSGSHMQRPTTPSGAETPPGGRSSPTTERYYGRGGVQNNLRNKKDKKDDKKERKLAGMRGIRGYL
ncbi:hypothetical protein DL770_007020 [Monosporascus sp. CRB-9-2]|nr:hypothetical protein DL770_007020 [Monosporascus sp. CRB-9-2]